MTFWVKTEFCSGFLYKFSVCAVNVEKGKKEWNNDMVFFLYVVPLLCIFFSFLGLKTCCMIKSGLIAF